MTNELLANDILVSSKNNKDFNNNFNRENMNNIINIEDKTINNNIVKTVNARELWERLESKQEFTHWIKNRLERFIENIDFVNDDKIINIEGTNLKREIKEYYLSIDCAKMICMLENNKQGDNIRKYFIECEKQLKEVKQLSPEEIILMQAQSLVNLKKEIKKTQEEQENQHKDILKLKHNFNRLETNSNYLTVIAYANLKNISSKDYRANVIGNYASRLCKKRNLLTGSIIDNRYGNIKTYPLEVLEESFNHYLE